MTISFRCSNPECRQSVHAPDGTGGRKARCPACGTIQTIPDAEVILPPRAEAPPADGVVCGDCGKTLPPDTMLCPRCGWVNPDSFDALSASSASSPALESPPPQPVAPPAPIPVAPPMVPPTPLSPVTIRPGGSMAFQCLKAPGYGFSNMGSLFKIVWCIIGMTILLQLLLFVLGFFGAFGMVVAVLMSVLGNLIIGGFCFRFYLDCAIGSLEGVNRAPDVPDFDFKTLLFTGIRWLGVVFVYILPIVTIPLLPLALLAWACTDDMRMFDLRWALRAVAKKIEQLGVLWLLMLLWGVVGGIAIFLCWLLVGALAGVLLPGATSGISRFFLGLILLIVGGFIVGVMSLAFMVTQFRCVGMLGRYNPILTNMLPVKTSALSVCVILGGIVVSAILWGTVLANL